MEQNDLFVLVESLFKLLELVLASSCLVLEHLGEHLDYLQGAQGQLLFTDFAEGELDQI